MTPSINRLAESAKALGQYIWYSEFGLVEDKFLYNSDLAETQTFEKFCNWVQGFNYYHAVVCMCEGQEAGIKAQLEADYEELAEARMGLIGG
jgi:hypothetical protein